MSAPKWDGLILARNGALGNMLTLELTEQFHTPVFMEGGFMSGIQFFQIGRLFLPGVEY